MLYMLSALLIAALGAASLLGVHAFRSEHLMAFRHRGRALLLFERDVAGRYRLIDPLQLPAAVWRFAGVKAAETWATGMRAALPRTPGRLARREERRARTAHA